MRTRTVVRDQRGIVHRFVFADHVGTCSCNRWAVAKIPMTAKRLEQLAKQYGKERFRGMDISQGVSFIELTKEQALRDWGYHVANLPERDHRSIEVEQE